VPELTGPRGLSRSPASLLLSTADRHASRPAVAVFVVTAAVAWLIVSVVKGFPPRWETIFQTSVARDIPERRGR
jgi:low affinity Fe/Cu permease